MESKNGFTLVEMAVVVAVCCVLAAVLAANSFAGFFLDESSARTSAAMTQACSNGRCIYQAAFADQMDRMFDGSACSAWPEDGDFATSTDYFIALVTNGVMDVTFDFFAAQGIPPAKSSNEADFKAENNAWKLVLGLNGAPDGTPFIFTRNYAISTVPVDEGPITPDQLMDNNGKPFGPVGLVVVQKGGAALKLTGKNLARQAFNPAGALMGGVELTVVGP